MESLNKPLEARAVTPAMLRTHWVAFALGAAAMAAATTLWLGLASPTVVHAQIPDAGAQRAAMVTQLVEMNQKLSATNALLSEIRGKLEKPRAGKDDEPKK